MGCKRDAPIAENPDASAASGADASTAPAVEATPKDVDGGSPAVAEPSSDASSTFKWEDYVFPDSHPCVRLRPKGNPPDLTRVPLSALPKSSAVRDFRQAERGVISRVTLKTHGAFGVGCACLPFRMDDDNAGFYEIQAVLMPGVKGNAYRERLGFILIGYFTGRNIDLHEYYRSLKLPAEWARESEDDPDPNAKSPEFCVEAWCYTIPDTDTSSDYGRFLIGVSLEHAAQFDAAGVPRCRTGRSSPPPPRPPPPPASRLRPG